MSNGVGASHDVSAFRCCACLIDELNVAVVSLFKIRSQILLNVTKATKRR